MDKIKKLMKSQKMTCENCEYYITNYKDFEDDIPYNRCNHPKLEWSLECYDSWLATNPDDFCSYFIVKGSVIDEADKSDEAAEESLSARWNRLCIQKVFEAISAPPVRYDIRAEFDDDIFNRLKAELNKENNK